MNYLDILVRASIDVAAAAENIKLPHAGTQVRGPPVLPEFRENHSVSALCPSLRTCYRGTHFAHSTVTPPLGEVR